MVQRRIVSIVFGFLTLLSATPVFAEVTDLDQDGIPDHEDEEVLVSTSRSLPAGEYTFRNLIVASSSTLVLLGDPSAPGDFKGVRINADFVSIEAGSAVRADGTGYQRPEDYPGAGEGVGSYGYGGRGGDWHYKTSSAIGGGTYGSAFEPKDLGSGGSPKSAGGGAIWLAVSGTLKNDGTISANGIKDRASGGSIYVTAGKLSGAGAFEARGAGCYGFWPYSGAGGGGRIAIYYTESEFNGTAEASRGATGSNSTCNGERTGQDGTSVFVDVTHNDVYLYNRFEFQSEGSPYTFNRLSLSEGAGVTAEDGVRITASTVVLDEGSSFYTDGIVALTAETLSIDGNSAFTSADGQILTLSTLTVRNGGEARLGREEASVLGTVTLEGGGRIIGTQERVLHLEAENISVDATSEISVTGAGHPPQTGPGYNNSGAGASYGGLGEAGTPSPIYGSETEPVDFGSGGSSKANGGGSVRIIVSGTLRNDGVISADATPSYNGASGGSIYVTAKKLSGSGSFTARGGNTRGYTAGIGAGGGGRIAIYYAESDFTGTTSAKGGDRYVGGAIQKWYYAQDGTVVFSEKEIVNSVDPLLLEYLPILRMHPDEDYLPMNVEAFVEGSALWDDAGVLPDELLEAYSAESPLTLERLASYDDSENLYLAFSDPEDSKSIDVGAGREKYEDLVASGTAKTTVYMYRMEDAYEDTLGREHTFTVLQYWYFYAMNDWEEKGGLNNHEGDWESVFVFLDEDDEPKYVAFSAHHNDGEAEPLNKLQYDSVRREWDEDDIDIEEDRVQSYVALGSHANYPMPGDHIVPGLGFIEDNIDSTSGTGMEIGEESFRMDEIGDLPVLFHYEGKWGSDQARPGEDGPQGPNFIDVSGHKRFREPIEWAGIDEIDEIETEAPETEFTFQGSGLRMNFGSTTVPEGSEFRISPYREPVFSGTVPQSTTLLPVSWEIDSSVPNDTFNVKVYFPIDETLASIKEKLRVYFFNPATDTWEKQISHLDETGEFIVLETTHFSRYAFGYEEETEVATQPPLAPASPIVGSGSRTQKLRVTEVALADAVVTEQILSSEEQITLLVQQALGLILEYILDTQKERRLTLEELEITKKLLKDLIESLE